MISDRIRANQGVKETSYDGDNHFHDTMGVDRVFGKAVEDMSLSKSTYADDLGAVDGTFGSHSSTAKNGNWVTAVTKNAVKETSYRQFHGLASR